MNYIDAILTELSSRLPELEWKISSVNAIFSSKSLPKGLFQRTHDLTGVVCIEEIKQDIHSLSKEKNQRSAMFLAMRINRKINVLVTLCQIYSRKNNQKEKANFGLKMINTRQQWLQSIESDIEVLELQQQAMIKALDQRKQSHNDPAILNLQKELGEVEKRLTLARETLTQAVL